MSVCFIPLNFYTLIITEADQKRRDPKFGFSAVFIVFEFITHDYCALYLSPLGVTPYFSL